MKYGSVSSGEELKQKSGRGYILEKNQI